MVYTEDSRYHHIFLFLGLSLALFSWLIGPAAYTAFHLRIGSFGEAVLPTDSDELSARVFIIAFIAAFSVLADMAMKNRFEAAKTLFRLKNNWLETIDSLPNPLFIHDAQYRVVRCNKAYKEYAGMPYQRIIGRQYFEVFPKMGRPFQTCQDSEKESGEEVCVSGKTFRIRFYSLNNLNGAQICAIHNMEDITEMKRAEKEREKIREELDHAHKMEAIGRFAAGVANDFNNILSVIKGNAELALESPDSKEWAQRMDSIFDSVSQATRITRQLMLLGREEKAAHAPLDINNAIEAVLKVMERVALDEDVYMIKDLNKRLWRIRANESNMEQALINLISFSRDSMPEGGFLTIKTRNTAIDEDACRTMPEARPGMAVCVTIEDTGQGIEKDALRHLFEPFFMRKKGGMGIGPLAAVYGIVKQQDGWISVKSKKGHGTVFSLYFPAIQEKSIQTQVN